MSQPIVYYTHPVHPEALGLLKRSCILLNHEGEGPPTPKEIGEEARDAYALCWFVPDIIDEAVLDTCPNLRILAGFPRGYDNVNLVAATRRGIWVTIGPDLMVEPTADLAWGLLLSISRRIISADAFVRLNKSVGWRSSRFLGHSIWRKTLGLIGMGRLGQAITSPEGRTTHWCHQ